jgi:hypothetical protein
MIVQHQSVGLEAFVRNISIKILINMDFKSILDYEQQGHEETMSFPQLGFHLPHALKYSIEDTLSTTQDRICSIVNVRVNTIEENDSSN